MSGVQFLGTKAILECYDELDLEEFAFFQGKELIVSGTGRDELQKWCERFSQTGSAATYKLRFYEGSGGMVKASSDYVCSFEIKFVDPYAGNGVVGGWGGNFLGRIEKLEKKLEGGSGSDDRLTDALYGLIEEPEKLVQTVGAIRALFGLGGAAMPAGIAGTEPANSSLILTPDDEAKVQRLSKALDKLEKRDPSIVLHLEKLATISETKPDTFKMLLGMLDNF